MYTREKHVYVNLTEKCYFIVLKKLVDKLHFSSINVFKLSFPIKCKKYVHTCSLRVIKY